MTERVRGERMMMMCIIDSNGENNLLAGLYVLWEIHIYVQIIEARRLKGTCLCSS